MPPQPATAADRRHEWVLAAPFRAHAFHLMGSTLASWQVIAYEAGVPHASMRTLMFGRNGRPRPRIARGMASRLIKVRQEDLAWTQCNDMDAERASTRVRLLRSHGVSWERIAEQLAIRIATCQSLARGELSRCPVTVDILAQSACDSFGLTSQRAEDTQTPGFDCVDHDIETKENLTPQVAA